ncbi:hypothetical protein GCM10019059_07360 [Camelimonas fluminis]|uniref:Integrase n=1 Tax=Camelimonas fluminis TaxID=1576911 RepID=A0ABV7UG46_9HYPH|nr:integrase [Camelimonas fluminis]GHE50798.1 hypothetical protein GCM10019059_07360 [Camelimonas fluminis]
MKRNGRPKAGVGKVDLPLYVSGYRNRAGRAYYYYQRYRGTDRVWPRLPMPFTPHDPEFWLRAAQYERLDAICEAGELSFGHTGHAGQRRPLPHPAKDPAGFLTALAEAHALYEREKAGDHKTFGALIDLFTQHAAYQSLKPKTRQEYDRYLDMIRGVCGDDAVRDLTTVDAQQAIDTFQDRPATARFFRAVLMRLVDFGIPRGYADANVVDKTEKVGADSTPYKPWPEWAFELFFEHARIGLHLPVYSALYTGQRSIDVIGMLRPAPEAEAIELVTHKTGGNVWAPIHSEYRDILVATHTDTALLHLREDGEAWTLAGFRTAWQRELSYGQCDPQKSPATRQAEAKREAADNPARAAAMTRIREAGLVFHGLRKNSVCMLLEAGCTETEVSRLVEMSEQMVRHYSRDIDARRVAKSAMRKLEDGWSDIRSTVLGKARNRLTEG